MKYLIAAASLTLLTACEVQVVSPESKYWGCMNEMARMWSQNRPSPEKGHEICLEKHIIQ